MALQIAARLTRQTTYQGLLLARCFIFPDSSDQLTVQAVRVTDGSEEVLQIATNVVRSLLSFKRLPNKELHILSLAVTERKTNYFNFNIFQTSSDISKHLETFSSLHMKTRGQQICQLVVPDVEALPSLTSAQYYGALQAKSDKCLCID